MSYENNGAPFGYFIDNTGSESIFLAPVLKWNIDESTLGEARSSISQLYD